MFKQTLICLKMEYFGITLYECKDPELHPKESAS